MRESRVFLNFFKENLLIIIVSGVVVGGAGYLWKDSQPTEYKASNLYKMEYSDSNINERVVLTDQAVMYLRASEVRNQLKLSQDLKTTIYKNGPLSIDVSTQGINKEQVVFANKAMGEFLASSFPITEVGIGNLEIVDKRSLIVALIGFGVGVIFGVLVSLIRVYFKNF